MSCVNVEIEFLLENLKRGKKRREGKIGLSSKSNRRGAENQIKNARSFFPFLNFRIYSNQKLFKARELFYAERSS
jgi:hypothetical protein